MDHHRRRASAGLVLTETDVELFRWLWMVRVLTLGQLRRVGYYQPDTGRLSSLDNVRKRLRRLWLKGYLQGETLRETHERIYLLGERALPALLEHCGIAQRRLYKPKGLDTMRQVRHALLISECAVRMVEALRGRPGSSKTSKTSMASVASAKLSGLSPFGLPFYHTHIVEHPLKKKHVERFVTQEDVPVVGCTKPFRIRPDLVFALSREKRGRLFFLEADRGTEGVPQVLQKQLGYHHLQSANDPKDLSRLRWQRYGEFSDYRVLCVTTTQQRIAALRRTLRNHPGFELWAFTTKENLAQANPVFDPIWTVSTGAARPLLKN